MNKLRVNGLQEGVTAESLNPPVYAYGEPLATGSLKLQPKDFMVVEHLKQELTDSGEHLWVEVEKMQKNTTDILHYLQKNTGISTKYISYAGMKDRQGITRQWFSIPWGARKQPPQWQPVENIRVVQCRRSQKKLRRGEHGGNSFAIVLRDISGDELDLDRRLQAIKTQGFPNLFGLQRFGYGGSNLPQAEALFLSGTGAGQRHKRGMLLSAARSYIFNQVIFTRIKQNNWNHYLPGDCLLDQTERRIPITDKSEAEAAIIAGSGYNTGPLWGIGKIPTTDQALQLEQTVARQYPLFTQGLENAKMKQTRRRLSIVPQGLTWEFKTEDKTESRQLHLSFTLPVGSYATSLLRELIKIQEGGNNKNERKS